MPGGAEARVIDRDAPARVFFPCTGLGRERRGFEAFTRECSVAMATFRRVEVTVFGGGGDLLPDERAVWNMPRSGTAARVIAQMLGRDAYYVEQASFFAAFATHLALGKPDLVYFADLSLGNACWHWRRLTGQRFRLLYYNGGPTTQPFTRCDVVQQVSPEHMASARVRGEPAERQFLLPHGVDIARAFHQVMPDVRARCRAELGIPPGRPVIVSVGALNNSHKRMDHVIDGVAAMPSRPHLALIGAETPETPAVRAHAAERLADRCTIRTLPRDAVQRAYLAADAFVLASLVEGFGLAQVEALAAGLPCVAHDTGTTRYVLGPHGIIGDLTTAGTLTSLLERALTAGPSDAEARHAHAYANFSWDVLADRYADAFVECAGGRLPSFATVA